MTSFYSIIISTFSLVLVFNNTSFAQTTMSGGIGLTLLNIASKNSFEKSTTQIGTIYLKENNFLTYPTNTIRLKINRQIAKRFSASYHFMLFIRKIDITLMKLLVLDLFVATRVQLKLCQILILDL